jgi:hypothetical protein
VNGNQKKMIKSPLIMLVIVLLVSGSFCLIIKLSGYTYYVRSMFPLAVMPLIIVLLTVKAVSKAEENKNEKTKTYIFSSALLPLIAIFHVVSTFAASEWTTSDGNDTTFMYYGAYAIVILLCSMKLFFACVNVKVVRIGLGIVYSIVSISALLILLLMMLFAIAIPRSPSSSRGFLVSGSSTVVRSELSPNSIFLAEIINVDEGALGGSTLVYATRLNSDVNLFIGTLKRDSQRIYEGEWGEFEKMTLRWEGDNILYINEKQYAVK